MRPVVLETFELTKHLVERFAERFPGHDLGEAFARAKRVTHGRLLAEACQTGQNPSVNLKNSYYRDDETGCLFVAAKNGGTMAVVTCFHYPKVRLRRMQ